VYAEDLDQPAEKHALAWLVKPHAGCMEASQLKQPELKLIRYAARMSESGRCRGREKPSTPCSGRCRRMGTRAKPSRPSAPSVGSVRFGA